jgi:hypothetical protein
MLDGQRIEQSITRFRPTDHERWDGQAEARMTGSSSCLFADELPLGSALVSSDGTPTRSARDRDAQNKCRSFRGPVNPVTHLGQARRFARDYYRL